MKKVVVVGGGSGASTVLRGLQPHRLSITCVVTSFDSGGDSGKLVRDNLGFLPPGDVRQCFIACLGPDVAPVVRSIFSHRFSSNGNKGKSLGNLIMLAATEINGGDQQRGLDELCRVFGVKARILYVSTDSSRLCATLDDGTELVGEDVIDTRPHTDRRMITSVRLSPVAYIQNDVYEALVQADTIIFTPGDLYGSVIANTLVKDFADALQRSAAKLVYIVNVLTKANETRGYPASQFCQVLLRYLGREKFDAVLCNTTEIDEVHIKRYEAEEAHPVVVDCDELQRYTRRIVTGDFVDQSTPIVRHNSSRIAHALMEVIHAN